MQCSSCGAENPASAKFCSACGVSTSIPPKPITCPACRRENLRAAKFCIECGTRLTAAAAAATPVAPGVAAPVAPVAGINETTAVGATAKVAPPPPAVGVATAPTAASQPGAAQPNPSAPNVTGAAPRLNAAEAMPAEFEPVTRNAHLEWTVALLVLLVALGLARWLWSMQNETHQAEMAMSAAFPKGGKAVPASVQTLPPQSTSTTSYGPAAPTPPAVSQPAMDTATVVPLTVEAPPVANAKPKKPSNPAPKKAEEPISQRRLAEADRVLEPPRTVPNSTRAKVAECRQLSLFSRERCMWSICDGQWGKDGCPSYER